jgi:hypothetical protein
VLDFPYHNLFYDCYSLKNVSILDLTQIDDGSELFYDCYSLKNVFIGKMCSNAEYMFEYCYALENVIIEDATELTGSYDMFYECYSLKQLFLPPTPNLTDASYMFEVCLALQTVHFADLSSLESAYEMFSDCYSLLKVSFPPTPSLTDMDYMFDNCYSVTEITFEDLSSLSSVYSPFYDCYSLKRVSLSGLPVNYYMSNPFTYTSALESLYLPSAPSGLDYLLEFCYSLRTLEIEDCSNLASPGSSFISIAPVLSKIRIPNMATDFSIADCSLSREALVQVFEDLAVVGSANINISGNWGEPLLTSEDIQIATDKGWTIGPF